MYHQDLGPVIRQYFYQKNQNQNQKKLSTLLERFRSLSNEGYTLYIPEDGIGMPLDILKTYQELLTITKHAKLIHLLDILIHKYDISDKNTIPIIFDFLEHTTLRNIISLKQKIYNKKNLQIT